MSRVCSHCSVPIIVTKRVEHKKYCSDYCRGAANSIKPERRDQMKKYQQTDQYKKSHAASGKKYRSKIGVDAQRASRYNLSLEEMRAILDAGCYAGGCKKTTDLHIDHDHACCQRRSGSCGKCVRGALCGFHNNYLGYLEKDWQFAIWAMRQPSLVLKIRREA